MEATILQIKYACSANVFSLVSLSYQATLSHRASTYHVFGSVFDLLTNCLYQTMLPLQNHVIFSTQLLTPCIFHCKNMGSIF